MDRYIVTEGTQEEPVPELASVQDISAAPLFRRCVMCGLWKAASEFHNSRTGQFSYCRECRRAYDRRYYQERGKATRRVRQRARMLEARAWMAALEEGCALRGLRAGIPGVGDALGSPSRLRES